MSVEFWESLFVEYGHTYETFPVGKRCVFTDEPDNIRAILATQFQDYGKGEHFHKQWYDFLGDSIFATDLEQWHESRQLFRPLLVKDRVSDLAVFEKHAEKLLRVIDDAAGPVDMASLFFRFSLDTATDFLLGHSVNSLDDPQVEFAEAFQQVQKIQCYIMRAGSVGCLPRHLLADASPGR